MDVFPRPTVVLVELISRPPGNETKMIPIPCVFIRTVRHIACNLVFMANPLEPTQHVFLKQISVSSSLDSMTVVTCSCSPAQPKVCAVSEF